MVRATLLNFILLKHETSIPKKLNIRFSVISQMSKTHEYQIHTDSQQYDEMVSSIDFMHHTMRAMTAEQTVNALYE